MKTERVLLTSWDHSWQDKDCLDIDWPAVHKAVGKEAVYWLLSQKKSNCQLIVEKLDTQYRLIAEFYDRNCLVCFQLMREHDK